MELPSDIERMLMEMQITFVLIIILIIALIVLGFWIKHFIRKYSTQNHPSSEDWELEKVICKKEHEYRGIKYNVTTVKYSPSSHFYMIRLIGEPSKQQGELISLLQEYLDFNPEFLSIFEYFENLEQLGLKESEFDTYAKNKIDELYDFCRNLEEKRIEKFNQLNQIIEKKKIFMENSE